MASHSGEICLYDTRLLVEYYRLLSESPKPVLAVFRVLEESGPMRVPEIVRSSKYRKTKVYEALRWLKERGLVKSHKGLYFLVKAA